MATKKRGILLQNFAKPEGYLGNMVSEYMATDYYDVNMSAVETLNVQEEDKILEIGYGPGVAIEEISKRASKGFVAGIDYSELMLAKAKKRNIIAIEAGRVDLRHANVSSLPDFGTTFDKIIAINNVMYWENPAESFWGLRQILRPGGSMAVVIQRPLAAIQQGWHNNEIGFYAECFQRAGFSPVGFLVEPVTKTRKKYSFGLGNYTKNANNQNGTLGCIYIYGVNPTPNQILMSYNQNRQSHIRSKQIPLQSQIKFLFQGDEQNPAFNC